MPNSWLLLDINGSEVKAELQLPLSELETAFGNAVNQHPDDLVSRLGPQLNAYLLQHIHPVSMDGKKWTVRIDKMLVQPVQQSLSGPYNELRVLLTWTPPANETPRHFMLNYDVIIHQVVTHFALVSVRRDWDNAQTADHPYQVAVIRVNTVENKLYPVEINVQAGTLWVGFTNMVSLGMNHIKEGTDHLLFLLTLLLPATLMVRNKKWNGFVGTKASLVNILKIVTAFTIGHSITLIIGALGIFHFPGRVIEVLIALSILISAIHAYRPLFAGKEMYIAAGFGLIHGMAFAETLLNLNLDGLRMTLSILGFNIGIELMQLFVIAIVIPWLMLMSRTTVYPVFRTAGAIFAGIAALAWITERISSQSNLVTKVILRLTDYELWLVLAIAIFAVVAFATSRLKKALLI
ncbi:HupE/UreJ family protein [Mucilaginibacter dorajii]|uniref:HupE/UreJ family protein n=2 Tax=Mucilaginibacter dorajii TaxID=692994 RepID=A0ABP7Q1V2_9SPHI